MITEEQGIQLLNSRLELMFHITHSIGFQKFFKISCHRLAKLRLDLELAKVTLTRYIKIDEDFSEKGIELFRFSSDHSSKVRMGVLISIIDVVNLTQGILRNLSFIDPQQSLQSDVSQFRGLFEESTDLLQCFKFHIGLHLSIDGHTEGTLTEEEVHLSTERYFFSFLPSTLGRVTVPAS